MADTELVYKVKQIVIQEEQPDAIVSVDGREFLCHYHPAEEGQGLDHWMCSETYFASALAKERYPWLH